LNPSRVDFDSPKTFIEPASFIVIALLAGRTRLVKYFPGATNGGLFLTSGIAAAGCILHDAIYDRTTPSLSQKVAVIAFASITSGIMTRSLKGRVSLSFTNNLKIIGMGSGVVLLKELGQRVMTLQRDLQTAQGRIGTLNAGLQTAQADLREEQRKVTNLERDLQTAQGRIGTLNAGLQTAQADLRAEQRKVTNLERALQTAQGRIGTLNAGLQTAQADLRAEQRKVTNLERALQTAQGLEVEELPIEETSTECFEACEAIRDLKIFTSYTKENFSLDADVQQFNLNSALGFLQATPDLFATERYKELFSVNGETAIEVGKQQTIKNLIQRYRIPDPSLQTEEAGRLINRIFTYLLLKKQQFDQHSSSSSEPLKEFIKKILESLIDAHTNCEDQVLSQIENILLDILEDMNENDIKNKCGISILRYNLDSLKETLVKEFADRGETVELEREVKKQFFTNYLGEPPTFIEMGPRYGGIFPNIKENASHVIALTLEQIDPIGYLLKEINQTGQQRILFNLMCKWYSENYFEKMDEDSPLKAELQRCLGGLDASFNFSSNKESILYFLLKNNIIKQV